MTIAALIPDSQNDSAGAASWNRQELEARLAAGGVLDVPAGRYSLDRAVRLAPRHAGGRLRGAGAGRTALANGFTQSPYWDNQTLSALGAGLGYELAADGNPWSLTKDPASVTVADPTNFPLGRVAYFWAWDGYLTPEGTRAVRRQVVAVDGDRVAFNSPIPAGLNALKLVGGWAAGAVAEGESVVLASGHGLSLGDLVFLTDGPALANEAVGEYRTVAGTKGDGVALDRPPRRSYAHPTLCPIDAVRGLAFEGVTLDQPAHGQAECASFKYAFGLTLRGVHAPGNVALTGCAAVTVEGCRFGRLSLNSCHDVRVRDCHFGDVYLEEACFDCTFDGVTVGPAPVNGVYTAVGCERLTFRRTTVYGAGVYPVALDGRELVLEGIDSHGPGQCFVGGARSRVSGWRSAGPLVMHAGREQLVLGVHAPAVYLGWFDGAGSPLPDTGGRACGVVGDVKGNLRDGSGDRPDPAKWVVT